MGSVKGTPIIFNPSENEGNKYIEIMVRPLRENGYQVYPLDGFLSGWTHFRSIRLVHLNWFENVDDSSFLRAFRSFVRKMFVLSVIHWSRKKLVWTMHNRTSHEKKLGFFSRTITKFLVKWSDRIVIHNHLSAKILSEKSPKAATKLFHLPHPDFIGIYGPPIKQRENTPKEVLSLLFIGAVKPYKNIELLINAVQPFSDQVSLTIAGEPNPASYGETISRLASSAGNIRLILDFIPDAELPRVIGESDLLILPYDLKSSLNSGTALLAFSYQKTVICPEIGTIEDLEEAKQYVFHYQYSTEEEHLQSLIGQIGKALELKEKDLSILPGLGTSMFEYIKSAHEKSKVNEKLINLYQDLLN